MLFNRGTRRGEGQAGPSLGDADGGDARLVGGELAAARERLGWTLPDIAAHLRIRLPFLAAIEQGRLDQLPGTAYAIGFVRTYAKALGLEPDEIARRFRSEAAEVSRKPELAFPAPVPERGVPAGAVVLLGAVLAIGAYIGWYKATGEKPGLEPVRPVPERLAELATPAPSAPAAIQPPTTPSPATPSPTTLSPAASPRAPGTPLANLPATPPLPGTPLLPGTLAAATPAGAPLAVPPPVLPFPSVPPSSAAAAVVPNAIPPALTVQPAPAAATDAALPEGTRIVLRARADAWIQVRDRQGQVLLNRVLRPGETWPVPPKLPLLLTTGNAGGTELLVDGALTPSLGNDGAVRRDLALDADAIRDGKLAVPLAAAAPPRPAARP